MNTQRNLSILILIISLTISGCGSGQLFGPTLTPTPTITLSPTATRTLTPTMTPTSTITPTETPTLSPQEAIERDYGALVPKDEKCVEFPDVISNPDSTQTGTHYAQLLVYATNPNNAVWMKIPLGPPQDKKEREVLVLPVVCRDGNNNVIKLLVILGGKDFGKNGADLNEYYLVKSEGNISSFAFKVTPANEMLNFIQEGDIIYISVAIKPGEGPIKNRNNEGATNELQVLALNMLRYDSEYSEAVNLLAQGEGNLSNDFVIIPARIELPLR